MRKTKENAMRKTKENAMPRDEEKLLDRLFNSSAEEWKVDPAPEGKLVSDFGPVSTMVLPAEWEPGRSLHNLLGMSAFDEFTPAKDPEVRFIHFYRGLPNEEQIARTFAEILRQPPHALKPAETAGIAPLLRDKDNSEKFDVLGIQTVDLAGKRVLELRGIYKEDEKPMMVLLVSPDGSGLIVQELEYQAPLEKYAQYLPEIERAIKSISWKL